jgi:bifunctional non-homologous end joining protein LigD
MRHPSYQGLREDKAAKDVVLEVAQPQARVAREEGPRAVKSKRMERKTLLNPNEESQTKSVGGHEISFSHLSKIYWPKEKYTKRDLLNYYYQMAPYILPYLKDRPMSLNRFPEGITGHGFYQKDVTGKAPDWATLYAYHSEGEAQEKHFLVATDEASLLYMAGLGCIEMNPWSSRVDSPDNPDWCLLDLDPSKNDFDQVIETARVIHDILESIKVPGYCKTSGSTGLHVYIPLAAQYTYDQSKEFAHIIVEMVQRQLPKITSLERTVSKRGSKIYLDFLQNRPQATLASAYSLRPKPGATVSMPLEWDEVKKGLKMSDFTILNAFDRVKERGDIFKAVLGKGIDMSKAIQKLQAL